MDLDPFEPVGIGASTMSFLDVFLMHCLLKHSPPDTPQEIAEIRNARENDLADAEESGEAERERQAWLPLRAA